MYRRIFSFGAFWIFFLLFAGLVSDSTVFSVQAQVSGSAVSAETVRNSQPVLKTEAPEASGTSPAPIFQGTEAVSDSKKGGSGTFGSSVVLSNGVRQMLFSIGIVTLLFMVLILILKKCSPKDRELTSDVFEILGKTHFMHRQQICLMRCGQKLFLVSVSQNGVDRIGEIDDPAEVDRLTRRCHGEVLGTAAPRLRKEADGEDS